MNNDLTLVKPLKSKEILVKQSKLNISHSIPFRSLFLSPSTGGKTTLMVHLIMKNYKDCFSKIYIFSPTVNSDPAWTPVIKYTKDDPNQDNKADKCLFEDYVESEMSEVIEGHKMIVEHLKKKSDNNQDVFHLDYSR